MKITIRKKKLSNDEYSLYLDCYMGVDTNGKPKEKVLLSDFQLWHHPLNYWHIADNEEQSLNFDRLLKNGNVKWGDIGNYPQHIKSKIEKSWKRIFDMNYCSEYAADVFENKSIQATFWNLSLDEVVKVDEFTAR